MGKWKVLSSLDNAEWKPVTIEGGFTDLDGLVGIEELVGYSVETEKRKAVKRKNLEEVESLTDDDKLKKKKKKNRKKSSKTKLKSPHDGFHIEKTAKREDEVGKFVRKPASDSSSDDEDDPTNEEEADSGDNGEVEEEVGNVDTADLLPWTNICVPDELSRPLVEMGFHSPTEIQRLCIPAAIKGRRDILGAAETGSGKTLAFGLPMIYGVMKNLSIPTEDPSNDGEGSEFESDAEDDKDMGLVKVQNLGMERHTEGESRLYGLVVTPTRELAIQIKEHLAAAIKYTPVKVAVIVGGMSIDKQTRLLKKKPHIVVGTPGRLWELISTGDPHLSTVRHIKFLAIDETDRMIERDHYPELRSLLECINMDEETAGKRQNFVFSATLTLTHEAPQYLKKKRKKSKNLTAEHKLNNLIALIGMKNYKIVDVTQKTGVAQKLKEAKISCTFDEKDFYLFYLLSLYREHTLVFCNSISAVRRLASLLTHLGRPPFPLHANMQQRQRLKNLDKFKSSADGVLLATDVAARGLDIPLVKNVIHYQVPRTSEGYVHRSGRTARAEQDGLTILLIEPAELNLYTRICVTLKRDKDLTEFPIDMMALAKVKERVKLGREIDALSLKLKKQKSQNGWLDKAAEEMDIILDDDIRRVEMDNREEADVRRTLNKKKKQLETLNAKLIGRATASAAVTVETKKATAKVNKPKLYKKRKSLNT
uniref:ATP-dependent RNA helicase n=1 Tax=Lygus hesperus TaxID=30085 RepID=A0A0K8T2W3_LYGHE